METIRAFSLAFTAIFVALDIIGAVPMYLALTQSLNLSAKRQIVNTSMLVAFLVAFVFLFIGQSVFKHLGIEVIDFKVAGGLVLLLISLADLLSGPEKTREGTSGSTGVVPLAVPLITGPGVLTTVILQSGTVGYVIPMVALMANYALAWFVLRHSDRVARLIGRDGTVIISKVAALFLAAIAIAMIRSGISEAIRSFHSVSQA